MPYYTITAWENRPEFGGPIFSATLNGDHYKVSAVNYSFPAHDGDHIFHEVLVWRNGEEVYHAKDTHDAVGIFQEYFASEGIDA